MVKITVVAIPEAPAITGAAVCAGQSATLQVTNAAPALTYSWFTAETGGSALASGSSFTTNQLTATASYYVEAVNTTGCTSPRTKVTVTVNEVPAKPVITQEANQLTASVAGAAYEWLKDGVTIAGATTQTITIAEAGNYTVRVKNEAGCSSELSDAFAATVLPTGIEDELAAGVIVAPNPAPGKFKISTAEPLQQVNVVVTNLLGSVVYRTALPYLQDEVEVDLTHLPSGLYLVQVQAKKLRVIRKVVLKK